MPAAIQLLLKRYRRRKGVALIFALAAIILITVIILAFFSRAELNRQIFFTSTNQVRADLVSRAATDILVGEIREEIRNGSSTSSVYNGGNANYPLIYQPTSTANVVMQPQSGMTFPIMNISASGVGIYSGGRVLGSDVSVSQPSVNGRYIPNAASWFGSADTVGAIGPNLGTGTLPTWVFVGRGGIEATPALGSANNPTSPDYVIGRFAYTVYDIGSLLNANVAGYYPVTETSNSPFKGSLAYADLSQLGLAIPSSDMTQAAEADLISWRNPIEYAGGQGTSTNYAYYVQNYGTPNGFRSTELGDNAFLSRQDLINFTQAGLGVSSASLPYLTHFSRSLNAPSYGPIADATAMGGSGSTYAYNTNANNTSGQPNRFLPNVRFTSGGTIIHYNDAGTLQTYTVHTGDPLVQRRFSLAKLAWITTDGTPPSGVSTAAILSCFGLQWENSPSTVTIGSDSSVTGGYGWVYTGSKAALSSPPPPAATSIETLDQVAKEGREPNFFELLQAGILSGVLGVNASGVAGGKAQAYSSSAFSGDFPYAIQASTYMQVLTIGANLIDQYKGTDSDPTVLVGGWITPGGVTDYDMITGSKSLPMIASYFDIAGQDPNAATGNLALFISVSLWDPYLSPITLPSNTLPSIRVKVEGGYLFYDGWAVSAGANGHLPAPSAPADGWAVITTNDYANFSSTNGGVGTSPVTPTEVSQSQDWATIPSLKVRVMGKNSSVMGFQFPDTLTTPNNSTQAYDTGIIYLDDVLGTGSEPFNIVTEYYSKNVNTPTGPGGWIPYSFLDGINDQATWRDGQLHEVWGSGMGTNDLPGPFVSSVTGAAFDYKNEPRSMRFNEEQWEDTSLTAPDDVFFPLSFLSVNSLIATLYPQPQVIPNLFLKTASPTAPPYFSPASLAFNTGPTIKGVGGGTLVGAYPDLDGVQRMADYALSCPNPSSTTGAVSAMYYQYTPYGSTSSATSSSAVPTAPAEPYYLPTILDRPFLSVGEMGYSFIDLPWRSIDFFSQYSAFGGLLDIFSLADEPAVVDDRVNLNSPQPVMMQSLLSGAAQNPDGSSPLPSSSPAAIADQYYTDFLTATGAVSSAATAPLTSSLTTATLTTALPVNVAQLPEFLSTLGTTTAYGLDAVKSHRETVVRALAGTTQTRTWNVLIDVVAQVGRYATTAQSLNDFIVEGEKRYWLSVAIDRYTGKVISQSLEPVNE